MKHSTVIFDLGGTLIDNWDSKGFSECIREIAGVLGLDADDVVARWMSEDASVRTLVGEFPDFASQVEHCCGVSLTSIPPDRLAEAERLHLDFSRRSATPRGDAIAVLSELRERGYRIGLLSDCGWDIPMLWESTPFAPLFDEPVFSCTAGLRKPDPRFFQFVCDRLGVQPRECVYVADGNSLELTGAKQAGMSPVLICVPYEREIIMQRDDPRSWEGPVIENLSELLSML